MEMPIFNKMQGTEAENLAVKIFTEVCCNGCTCTSSSDHKREAQATEYTLDEIM
jgi:hypothetical protein